MGIIDSCPFSLIWRGHRGAGPLWIWVLEEVLSPGSTDPVGLMERYLAPSSPLLLAFPAPSHCRVLRSSPPGALCRFPDPGSLQYFFPKEVSGNC